MTSFQRDTLLLRWPPFPRKHVLAKAGAGIHRLIQGALPDSAEIAGTPPSSAPRRGPMRYDGQRFGAMTRARDGLEINGMAANRDTRYLRGLLQELRSSHEAEWVEFKVNNENPALIGEYVSALSLSMSRPGAAE